MSDVVTITETETLVVTQESVSVIQTAGTQGPPGPPGPAGGQALVKTADVTLSGHRVVRATSALGVNYADNQTPSHAATVVGVTTGAALLGAAVIVQVSGEIVEPSWAWTPNLPVYCGPNGTLTQTPPSSGWLLEIGFAVAATQLFIRAKTPIFLS